MYEPELRARNAASRTSSSKKTRESGIVFISPSAAIYLEMSIHFSVCADPVQLPLHVQHGTPPIHRQGAAFVSRSNQRKPPVRRAAVLPAEIRVGAPRLPPLLSYRHRRRAGFRTS